MCLARNGPNRLGGNLGKCFQRLTSGGRRRSPGGNRPALIGPRSAHRCLVGVSEACTPDRRRRELRGMAHRDYWYDANSNIIKALGRATNLHGDVVFEFLYALTLQNFARVLNPQAQGWNNARVPLSNFDSCDYYMGIFDCNGNVRNPYHPESLLKLLSVMQLVLRQEKSRDCGSKRQVSNAISILGMTREEKNLELNRRIAERAGFGPDSLARANGLRRRFRMGEKYRLEGLRGAVNPQLGQSTWNSYSKSFAQIFGPLANKLETSGGPRPNGNSQVVGNGTNVFCDKDSAPARGQDRAKELAQRRELNKLLFGENIEALIKECAFSDSLRCQELRCLISSVKQKTSIKADVNSLVSALKDMDLNMAVKDEDALRRGLHNKLSKDYSRMTTRRQHGSYGVPPPRSLLHPELQNENEHPAHDKAPARRPIRRKIVVHEEKPIKVNYYYGGQIPVLAHEPFDRSAPRSWMRRHPKSSRMNENDEIVETGSIRRYKRQTVQRQFDEARLRHSVRSIYSSSDLLAEQQKMK
ncbi:hypothetical protein ACLKA7_004404 [Drosophila subpalustris]